MLGKANVPTIRNLNNLDQLGTKEMRAQEYIDASRNSNKDPFPRIIVFKTLLIETNNGNKGCNIKDHDKLKEETYEPHMDVVEETPSQCQRLVTISQ